MFTLVVWKKEKAFHFSFAKNFVVQRFVKSRFHCTTVAFYNYNDHVFDYGFIYLVSFAAFLGKTLFDITQDIFGHIKANLDNIHVG